MTQQLADARAAVEQSMGQVDAARANLQTILDNLTAGVIVLDAQRQHPVVQPGRHAHPARAAGGLRRPAAGRGRRAWRRSAQPCSSSSTTSWTRRQQHGLDHWQQSFELNAAQPGAPQATPITLVARGRRRLPGRRARLLVFDDISEIVSAQRAQAWGEVARRLAHEIKNPLTPIQLSAERLEMKLAGKVAEPEQAMLTKSVQTIVDQVDCDEAAGQRVPRLRATAGRRTQAGRPECAGAATCCSSMRAKADATPAAARAGARGAGPATARAILGDAQQLRQVIHNLLQNAAGRDAKARPHARRA